MKALEMRMQKLVLDLSLAQVLPEKINKILTPNGLGFIDVNRTVAMLLLWKSPNQRDQAVKTHFILYFNHWIRFVSCMYVRVKWVGTEKNKVVNFIHCFEVAKLFECHIDPITQLLKQNSISILLQNWPIEKIDLKNRCFLTTFQIEYPPYFSVRGDFKVSRWDFCHLPDWLIKNDWAFQTCMF